MNSDKYDWLEKFRIIYNEVLGDQTACRSKREHQAAKNIACSAVPKRNSTDTCVHLQGHFFKCESLNQKGKIIFFSAINCQLHNGT